jgi:hypothetical protein
MNFISDKKKLIQILFGIAVLVLIANLLANKFFRKNDLAFEEGKEDINTVEIQKRFITSLHNLGINDLWIDSVKSSSLEFSYRVYIPKDLPIVIVVNEIDNSFTSEEAIVTSEEKVMGGKTLLKIFSGNKMKLASELTYSDKIERTAGKAGFLLKVSGTEIDSVLLKYPESFALLLVPSKSSAESVQEILNNRKEYVVYLNDDISELDYKLDKGYSNARLKNSIRGIVGSFSKAVFVLVDDKSNLYSSGIFPFVEEELLKRKIKLIKESSLINIGLEKDVVSQFRSVLNTTPGNKSSLIIISAEDFFTIQQEITSHRKIGYKFVKPSDIVFQDTLK